MKKSLGTLVLILAFATPAGAQMTGSSASGMDAMQYYVGSWSCMAGEVGQPPQKASATYTLDSGVLHEMVNVPAQGTMKTPYVASSAETYDAKKHRYVETWLGNDAGWSVSNMGSISGNTEHWADQANSTGKLGRTMTVRTSQNRFDFTGYPTVTSTKANFKGYCTRA